MKRDSVSGFIRADTVSYSPSYVSRRPVQGVKVGEDLGLSPRSGDMEERSA